MVGVEAIEHRLVVGRAPRLHFGAIGAIAAIAIAAVAAAVPRGGFVGGQPAAGAGGRCGVFGAGAGEQLHVLAAEQSYQGVARARLAAATQAVYARIALYRALAGPFPLAAPAEPAVGTRNPQAAAAPAPAPSRG